MSLERDQYSRALALPPVLGQRKGFGLLMRRSQSHSLRRRCRFVDQVCDGSGMRDVDGMPGVHVDDSRRFAPTSCAVRRAGSSDLPS